MVWSLSDANSFQIFHQSKTLSSVKYTIKIPCLRHRINHFGLQSRIVSSGYLLLPKMDLNKWTKNKLRLIVVEKLQKRNQIGSGKLSQNI